MRQHRRVYEGRVVSLDVDEVSEPGGVEGTREVVRQSGSVAALPVLADGRIVLVRQYRYAVDDFVWELPAGRRDAGETPEAGARRELEEEVGLRAGALEPLVVFWTTPGFCDEVMHLFRATAARGRPAAARGRRADRAGHVHARRGDGDARPRRDPRGQDAGGAAARGAAARLRLRLRRPRVSEARSAAPARTGAATSPAARPEAPTRPGSTGAIRWTPAGPRSGSAPRGGPSPWRASGC